MAYAWWLQQEEACMLRLKSRSLMLALALSTLYSLGVGLLGPIYPIFVVNRFSATIMDVGLLYALFCGVAPYSKLLQESFQTLMGRNESSQSAS